VLKSISVNEVEVVDVETYPVEVDIMHRPEAQAPEIMLISGIETYPIEKQMPLCQKVD
jgi:hypothetical protein